MLLAIWVLVPAVAHPAPNAQVVSLRVTHQSFSEHRPWTKGTPSTRIGSAVVLQGSQLLTEAKLIRDAILIQVQKNGSATRVPARVVHVDEDIDLALLEVDEPGFFDDLEAAQFAKSAPGEGTVYSARWQNQQYEISESQIAGINVRENPNGSITHAFLSLHTNLSNGGWADPVFSNGKLVGLSVLQEGQRSIAIPVEILSAYVRGARSAGSGTDSANDSGFASFRPYWQFGQDPALAAYLGLTGKPRGIVLRWMPWGSTGCDALEPRDLILSVEGHALDAMGNFEHPHYGQLAFQHILVDSHRPGDRVRFQLLRDGKTLDVDVELRRNPGADWLIPDRRDQAQPPYLVAGGLVLRELDGNYLRAWGNDWHRDAPPKLVQRYDRERESQTEERRRILILSQVLPDPHNLGYHQLANLALAEINDRRVYSVADADEAFRHPVGGFHTLKFYRDDLRREIVLDAADFEEATARILANYDIPARIRLRPPGRKRATVECESQDPEYR
jgi:S1-C subfamily serine protease